MDEHVTFDPKYSSIKRAYVDPGKRIRRSKTS